MKAAYLEQTGGPEVFKYGELPEKFREKLKVVMKRGWQLNDLIDNLLDLAKIESDTP